MAKQIMIKKAPLDNSFLGISNAVIGKAVGELKLCGLKVLLYLSSNKDGITWTLNPAAFAHWMQLDYTNSSQARACRKILDDGLKNLIEAGYLKEQGGDLLVFVEDKQL